MNFARLYQKICFRLRTGVPFQSALRKAWWSLLGARIGRGTKISQMQINWPHQVSIGNHCQLEDFIFFKYDKWWEEGPSIIIGNNVFLGRGCEFNICERITIGDDCLIASGCKFIDHNHGIALDQPMRLQESINARIVLEENVWLGTNVMVLKGVHIGQGAIVGAGAVLTKSVGANEIWGGVPARKIGTRTASTVYEPTKPLVDSSTPA